MLLPLWNSGTEVPVPVVVRDIEDSAAEWAQLPAVVPSLPARGTLAAAALPPTSVLLIEPVWTLRGPAAAQRRLITGCDRPAAESRVRTQEDEEGKEQTGDEVEETETERGEVCMPRTPQARISRRSPANIPPSVR